MSYFYCVEDASADRGVGWNKVRSVVQNFQLHGVSAAEEPVLHKKLRRKEMMVAFFEKLPSTVVAIEACGCEPSLGTAAEIVRAYGEVDPASTGQAVCQTRQE
jgi:hypothetical protein